MKHDACSASDSAALRHREPMLHDCSGLHDGPLGQRSGMTPEQVPTAVRLRFRIRLVEAWQVVVWEFDPWCPRRNEHVVLGANAWIPVKRP